MSSVTRRGSVAAVKDRLIRRLLGSAVLLLIGAVTLYGVGMYQLWRVDWTPLERSIVLENGQRISGSFVAQTNVMYVLQLDTERRLRFEKQNCLLGIESNYPERCASVPVELDLSWVVSADGNTVARGVSHNSQGGYWGPTIGVVLGTFDGKRGQAYTVNVTVHRTSPELQPARPKLQVEVDPDAFKGAYVWASLATLAAQLGLLIAVSLVVVATVRWLWLRKHNQPMEPTGFAGGS